MTLRASRRLVHSSLLFVLAFLAGGACAGGVETVKIAPDKEGFVLHPSGDRHESPAAKPAKKKKANHL